MDRLQMKRGLVALSGLTLILATSGCRDRNLQVPPPAHYTEGAIPEAGTYPAAPMTPTDPATIAPYGAAGSFDPAASPAAGSYDPAASYGSYDATAPDAAGASYGSYPSAAYGTDPSASAAPAAYDAMAQGNTLASPSSPTPMGADPYGAVATALPVDGMTTPAAMAPQADFGAPPALPGLDGGAEAPTIPETLPMMP